MPLSIASLENDLPLVELSTCQKPRRYRIRRGAMSAIIMRRVRIYFHAIGRERKLGHRRRISKIRFGTLRVTSETLRNLFRCSAGIMKLALGLGSF